MGNIDGLKQERNRGEQWVKGMSMDQVHAFVDAMVLGDFWYPEWGLDAKPTGTFLTAAMDTAQYREETDTSYEL